MVEEKDKAPEVAEAVHQQSVETANKDEDLASHSAS